MAVRAKSGLKCTDCCAPTGHLWACAGRPRLQGELAVSRSLGDGHFQRYGLSAEPELSAWIRVGAGDQVLILASDGVFERFGGLTACGIAHSAATGAHLLGSRLAGLSVVGTDGMQEAQSDAEPCVGRCYSMSDVTVGATCCMLIRPPAEGCFGLNMPCASRHHGFTSARRGRGESQHMQQYPKPLSSRHGSSALHCCA